MIYLILTIIRTVYQIKGRISCRTKMKRSLKLARRLLSENCAKLVVFIKGIIHSEDFITQNRQNPSDFTRQRKLSFSILILFLINLIKGSYQDELDHFFKAVFKCDVAKRFVSKAALAKARMKLKYQAFIDLNSSLINYFYQNFQTLTWNGLNLLAIDGTTIQLPRIEVISKHFGAWKPRQGDECPMARVSQMFDPLNKLSVHAIIEPKETGERELAAFHCLKLMPGDLLLLDRGYPAYWLFNLILSLNSNFCARVQLKRWKVVRKFYHSGMKEKIIELSTVPTSIKKCKELGLDPIPLKLRLIRIELEHGETEILITSLIDCETYPHEQFADLYHLRWPVEEDYKTMKQWIEVENFSGKSVLSVFQDFYARVFAKNMATALAFQTWPLIEKNTQHRRYFYQANFAQTLSKLKDVIPLLFIRTKRNVLKILDSLVEIIIDTLEPVRPGRKFERNFNNRSGRFHYCYKPLR